MSTPKRGKKKAAKRLLALPDLEHAKIAVLNSLTSASGQRTYGHVLASRFLATRQSATPSRVLSMRPFSGGPPAHSLLGDLGRMATTTGLLCGLTDPLARPYKRSMNDEAPRWNRVKQVFQDALERPDADRGLFLCAVCGDDRELQSEVESLLVAHAAAGSFAQGPAIEALPPSAGAALRDGAWADQRLQHGDRIGHYEILSVLGKGGMGEVYRARDPRLGRDVAVKVLPLAFADRS